MSDNWYQSPTQQQTKERRERVKAAEKNRDMKAFAEAIKLLCRDDLPDCVSPEIYECWHEDLVAKFENELIKAARARGYID